MKSKLQALNEFWSGFDMTAYEENSVPSGDDAPDFPYITYEVGVGSFEENLLLTGSAWFRSTSWAGVDNMLRQLKEKVGRGGFSTPCEDGYMTVNLANPYAQTTGDESDDLIKRLLINVIVQFKTSI